MSRTFKILVAAALVTLAFCPTLLAQFKFGGKVSGTVNNMFLVQDSIKSVQRSSVSGFNIGAMAEYLFNENMSVGVEVMFAMQGFKRSWVSTYDHPAIVPSTESIVCRTFHLNIPILYRYYYKNLAIEVGPQVSICFGGKCCFHREQTIHEETLAFDTNYIFSSTEEEMQKKMSDFKL